MNGLLTKLTEFYAQVNAADFDIYMLTETHLNDSVFSCNVFPPNDFDIYRCDRSKNSSSKERGGGVLISVKKKLKSELILNGEQDGCEQIWIKIKNKNKLILMGCLYIPPASSCAIYDINLSLVKQICDCNSADKNTTVVLYGDFNLPTLKWIQSDIYENTLIPINVTNQTEETTIDSCNEIGLFQMNSILNDNDHILDLFWINEPDICVVQFCENNVLYNETHHKALSIEMDIPCDVENNATQHYYLDFVNADYDKINFEINSIDWNLILNSNCSFDDKIDKFYSIINKIINENVHKKKMKISNHPCWYDRVAINLKNRINRMHKKYKKSNNQDMYIEYIKLKKEFSDHIKVLYSDYKINIQQLISDDPQQFFKHVNLSRKYKDNLPSSMTFESQVANNPNNIAELFKLFFQSVYTNSDDCSINKFDDHYEATNKINVLKNVCQHVPNLSFDESDILKSISELPDNMVMGPDNIPNRFVKNSIQSIAKPIFAILHESYRSGKVPQIWKQSYIRPIYKNGKKSQIENYRGVAIQCVIPKMLDSILTKHLNRYTKNIITHHQHGFVNGKSTVTNLIEYTYNIMNDMLTHKQIEAIYLDLCKAFDSVNVKLLMHKLKIMGLSQSIINWITEYFNSRQQLVRIGSDVTSSPISVTSGVGQGSPISSTLFNLFLFDLPFFIENASISLYADDAKLFMPIICTNDCILLQNELNTVNEYFKINCMKLNERKTKAITFHRCALPIRFDYFLNSSIIERVNVIKDLGVLLDSKLIFKYHINFIVSKAKSILAWIKRYSYEFNDPWIIKTLFETFVLPILEYASHIWYPTNKCDIIRIESIQKQFLLYALRKFHWADRFKLPSYKNRLLFFHMNTLEDRRKIYQIAFIFSLINGIISSPSLLANLNINVPQRTTRNYTLLKCKFNKYESPFTLMKKQFNETFLIKNDRDEFIFDFNQSIQGLKQKLKNYFEK